MGRVKGAVGWLSEGNKRMNDNETLSEKYAQLREQAEERIKRWSQVDFHSPEDLHRIIHELKIHLAEQEIRNEELMKEIKAMDVRREN